MASKKTRVVVAMSGGVDSSVVALIYSKMGYEVVGITLQLYNVSMDEHRKFKSCCAGRDIYDAKEVATQLGIAHYVLDAKKEFKDKVIDNFFDSYKNGRTPIPCVKCNQHLKFNNLLNFSKDLGADFLATGHYIKRIREKQGINLYRARDKIKDQSYFLFQTKKTDLSYLRFPLGKLTKKQTRKMAKEMNLIVADKVDSQDICFIPKGNYRDLLAKYSVNQRKGCIENTDGKVLGEHNGIENFTIGQRRFLKISTGKPLYVVNIDANENKVIVGNKDDLKGYEINLSDVNWLGRSLEDKKLTEKKVFAKVRANQELAQATVSLYKNNLAKVKFDNPVHAVAKGQGCVFYSSNDQLLGGGWID